MTAIARTRTVMIMPGVKSVPDGGGGVVMAAAEAA